MSLATLLFSKVSPSAPALAAGAFLGAAGIGIRGVQTVGRTDAVGTANGDFQDSGGFGHFGYDSAGYLYAADMSNARVQRFLKNAGSGVWGYDSQVTLANAVGGGTQFTLLGIDQSRQQIHLGAHDFPGSPGMKVYNLSQWPGNVLVANAIRSYGNFAAANGAGALRQPLSLALDDTFAVLASITGDFRVIRYNHVTPAVDTEEVQAAAYHLGAAGGGAFFGGAASGAAAEPGLWALAFTAPGTIAGSTRLDTAGFSGGAVRRNRARVGNEFQGGFVCYGGRVYAREIFNGRILGWNSGSPFAYLDEFAWPGAVGSGKAPGLHNNNAVAYSAKIGLWVPPAGSTFSAELIAWSANGDSNNAQSFLTCFPLDTGTATWTYNSFSAGTNTLKALAVFGTSVAAEKCRVEVKKNAGAFTTVPFDKLGDAAWLAANLPTFTAGDLLTLRLSMSIWDRLDGLAGRTSTDSKIAPSEVQVAAIYDDTAVSTFTGVATGAWQGQLGASGGFQGRLG